jgi:HD-GYP domain-containing protein (c-di-GMP phosphodiesterase class II)
MPTKNESQLIAAIRQLGEIGVALTAEQDGNRLWEQILQGAMTLTGADAGTLYLVSHDNRLRFEVMHNNSLDLHRGGTSGQAVDLPALPLYDSDGNPNLHMVAAYAAIRQQTVNIADAYNVEDFDFNGTRQFDSNTGYHSKSFLTVPMKNRQGLVLGVLQLINATNSDTGEVTSFTPEDQLLAESLASQAAVAISNIRLRSRTEDTLQRVARLSELGIALSSERDISRLLERILGGARELTRADGGTLYLMTEDRHLRFEVMRTGSLGISQGGTTGKTIDLSPLPLYDSKGQPNLHMVAACAALQEKTINIADAYDAEGFDFSGTKKFDEAMGYHSKSFLTVPMKNHEDDIIGVLQLLNAQDPSTGEVVAFTKEDQQLAESLASQAAVALTTARLIEDQRILFESFIQLIAAAIDEKSPYTGGHCARVPELTLMLAEAVNAANDGPMADFHMSEQDIYELKIAAWLHDCGKVATPEYVVDKSTKLETIYDRIHLVNTRFEVLKRDLRIHMLEQALQQADVAVANSLQENLDKEIRQLDEELAFLQKANIGGEFMSEEHQDRVRQIAQRVWQEGDEIKPLLSEDEVYNLNIAKGTLTPEEREIINNHIVVTIKMLESLPYPKHLKHVPEYAGGHHERMDGKGYPRGLTRDQMSIQARIMGIADIFEALTAKDRPYKPGKTLTQSLFILGKMKEDHHVDPDLFDVFVNKKVYQRYAEMFLGPDQIDEVDESRIPGYLQ